MKSVYRSPEGKKAITDRYEQILKYWPLPCDMKSVSTSFGDTFVIACGAETDKAVILLHGSSTNSAMWMGDVARLGEKRRVYAIDIIGEPGKSSENRPEPLGTNYGEWLAQVMDGLGVKKAAVVGNSLGGWMAIALASYAPQRVESLVLIASGGLSSIRISSFALKALTFRLMGKKGEQKLNRLIYGDVEMPEEVLAFGRLIEKYYFPRISGYGAFPSEAFGKLTMPVLYIAGDNDKLLPTKKNVRKLKRLVPHAEIRILEGRPHALICLAEDIAAFIDKE